MSCSKENRLSIIIVNYQSRIFLKKCLLSLKKFLLENYNNVEVIIVNNDKELLFSDKKSLPSWLKAIEKGENLGFGKANNLAAKEATGDLFFFLNPDAELVDDSLLNLLVFFEKNKQDAAVISPLVIQADRHAPQPWTCGKKTSLLNIFFRNTLGKPWTKKTPQKVDWVSGTALLIEKSLFQKIGGFDENFFMYFEDQDLCLRAEKESGKKILFYPQAKILHHNGKSWNKNKFLQKKEFYKSQRYFFEKHQKRWQFSILKLLHKLTGKY